MRARQRLRQRLRQPDYAALRVDDTRAGAERAAAAVCACWPGLDRPAQAQYQPDGSWGVAFETLGGQSHVATAGMVLVYGGDALGAYSEQEFNERFETDV